MRLRWCVAIACVCIATTVNAQHAQTRKGFTISLGFGPGSARFRCDGCSDEREGSGSGYLRIGGTVRPNVIIAGQVDAWTKQQGGSTISGATVDAIVQWYPRAAGGFYVLGGAGFGSIDVSFDVLGGTYTSGKTGVGVNFGTGYDFRVARNFSISPYASYFYASTGSGSYSGGDKLSIGVVHVGIGFTIH